MLASNFQGSERHLIGKHDDRVDWKILVSSFQEKRDTGMRTEWFERYRRQPLRKEEFLWNV